MASADIVWVSAVSGWELNRFLLILSPGVQVTDG